MQRVGIMGGTFNPIHKGHLMIARAAQNAACLDRVIFLPSGQPPHKQNFMLASAISRLNMAILSVYGQKGFSVSDIEVFRPGITYTVDTLQTFAEQYKNAELHYIVGGDTLFQIRTWKNPEQVAALLKGSVVVPRPGDDMDALRRESKRLHSDIGLNIVISEQYGPNISSTELRKRIASKQSTDDMIPPPALDYIATHGLYQTPYSQMTLQLKRTLSDYRLRHTLSVSETAVWLANLFGVDPFQAHLAGMLHDCAKGMDAPTLLQLIRTGGVSADELELSMPALLHAPAGAALARTNYHVSDQNVLSAIRWHTTGRKNMTMLEKVVYLADMIEPCRAPHPGLDELRICARNDLDEAVRMAAALSAAYVSGRGKKIHPRTIELAGKESIEKYK